MSDELDKIVDAVSEPSFWSRILFMLAFAIASYFILLPLIIVLSVAQLLFTLFTGQSNANLRYFSATLALYIPQVLGFLTYLSEEKPYPFSDLPEVDDDSLNGEESATRAASEKAANKSETKSSTGSKDKTTTAKKTAGAKATKKKAAKKTATKKKAPKKAAERANKKESDASSEDAGDS